MKSTLALLVCLLAVSTAFAQKTPVKSFGFDENDFLHVVEGLLEGIGAAESWTDVQPCIETTEDAVQNIITAVEYFEKQDPVSVAYGLAALGKALEDLPTAIKACVASAEDVEILVKALEAISNPVTYIFIVAKNLIINGVDIYDEIYAAVDDFRAGNWKDFGFNVGEALAKIFFGGLDTDPKNPALIVPRMIWMRRQQLKFSFKDFANVTKGVIEGIGAAEGWDQLGPCINSTEDAVRNVIIAVQYLQKKDPIDVAYGLAALGKALSDLPTALKSCGSVAQDVEKLIQSLAAISNPTTFFFKVAKNLIVNGVDIYTEIYGAVDDFKVGNWEHFGYNIGKALAQVFLYGTVHRRIGSPQEVLLFLKGFVGGISADPLYNQIAPCLNNATQIGQLLDQAINDFISQDPDRVIEGLALLAQAIYHIPSAIKDCGVAYNQTQALIDAISQLQDPRTIVYRITRSLIINGDETWDKITEFTDNISNGKYEEAGRAVGIIIDNFIRPDDAVAGTRFTKFLEKKAPFKVNHNHKFVNWTRGQLKALVGTTLQNPADTKIPQVNTDDKNVKLPANFSSWTQWPQCEHPILDQAQCGSCWAFGAAETLTDRFCIASQGKVNVQLSPQYLVSCSTGNLGCNGGILTLAWASLERSGLPPIECTPYTSQSGDVKYCSDIESGCDDGSPFRRYYVKSWSTRWYISVNSIKTEILTNGPVESAFTVYEDFLAYAGGVYKYTSGAPLGGHAIKIIGWGVEEGQEYWLVANSWGADWGENGYFKMAIGDSGMDNSGIAGTADLKNLPKNFLIDEFLSF